MLIVGDLARPEVFRVGPLLICMVNPSSSSPSGILFLPHCGR